MLFNCYTNFISKLQIVWNEIGWQHIQKYFEKKKILFDEMLTKSWYFNKFKDNFFNNSKILSVFFQIIYLHFFLSKSVRKASTEATN